MPQDSVASKMTPEQISEVQRLHRKKPQKERERKP